MQPLQDVRIAFKQWTKNVMAFIITMIGVSLILGIVLLLVSFPIALILAIQTSGDVIQQLIALMQFWYPILHGNIEVVLTTNFLIILLPIIIVYTWIFGSIYHLCSSVVTFKTPTIGGPFMWLRSNALVLFIGGLILGILSVGPVLLSSIIIGYPIDYPLNWLFGITASIWYFVIIGITATFIPGLVDGLEIVQSLKKSLMIFIKNFKRVLGVEFLFLIMLGILFGPLPLYSVLHGSFEPSMDIVAALILSLSALGLFIMGFLILPMFYLAMTRLYEECKESC